MGLNDLSSSMAQRSIASWSLAGALGIGTISFLLGKTALAAGILFSSTLMVLNFRALSLVPGIYQRFKSPHLAKTAAFACYYLRFWLVVAILYLVIPNAGYNFALGSFIGFIIPKIAMGAIVIINTGEDWWLHRKAPVETYPGPEKLTPLEKELLNTNPFEFDMVEFEWKSYSQKESKD